MESPQAPQEALTLNQMIPYEKAIKELRDVFHLPDSTLHHLNNLFIWADRYPFPPVRLEILIPGEGAQRRDVVNIMLASSEHKGKGYSLYPFYNDFYQCYRLDAYETMRGQLTPDEELEFFNILIERTQLVAKMPRELQRRYRELKTIKAGVLTREEIAPIANLLDRSTYDQEATSIQHLLDQCLAGRRFSFEEWLEKGR